MSENVLNEAVKSLADAKNKVLQAIQGAKSPSVLHAAQVTVDHLDTTYLWLSQLGYFLQMTGEEGVEQAVEEAVANGKIIHGDFSREK